MMLEKCRNILGYLHTHLVGKCCSLTVCLKKIAENTIEKVAKGTYICIVVGVVYFTINIVLAIYWSTEPEVLDIMGEANMKAESMGLKEIKVGFISTVTAIKIGETLLNKPGGYIRNDIMPPGVFLDNMPNWELGVLIQLRDFTRSMRKDFSRSQSQSKEDPDLAIAEPQFNFDTNSWALPSSENEYERGIDRLNHYLHRLVKVDGNGQFFARADNLADWFKNVETRLGSLSQRLSACVGKPRLNVDVLDDSLSTDNELVVVKTPWSQIDDIFYEARGTSWALINLLTAIEKDFSDVLEKKNALVSLRQVVRELKETQISISSPIILNGDGFGFLANHSLVMANYISRANAAIIDLRRLLEQG